MAGIERQVDKVLLEGDESRYRRELDDDLDFFDPFDEAESDYEKARTSMVIGNFVLVKLSK